MRHTCEALVRWFALEPTPFESPSGAACLVLPARPRWDVHGSIPIHIYGAQTIHQHTPNYRRPPAESVCCLQHHRCTLCPALRSCVHRSGTLLGTARARQAQCASLLPLHACTPRKIQCGVHQAQAIFWHTWHNQSPRLRSLRLHRRPCPRVVAIGRRSRSTQFLQSRLDSNPAAMRPRAHALLLLLLVPTTSVTAGDDPAGDPVCAGSRSAPNFLSPCCTDCADFLLHVTAHIDCLHQLPPDLIRAATAPYRGVNSAIF